MSPRHGTGTTPTQSSLLGYFTGFLSGFNERLRRELDLSGVARPKTCCGLVMGKAWGAWTTALPTAPDGRRGQPQAVRQFPTPPPQVIFIWAKP